MEENKKVEASEAEQSLSKKEERRQKRATRKAEKKAARAALSFRQRLSKHLMRVFVVVVVVYMICDTFMPAIENAISAVAKDVVMGIIDSTEVTEEEIKAEVADNPEMAEKVDAMPGYDPEDTWAVYIYMCGSDLEAGRASHLSDLTKHMVTAELKQTPVPYSGDDRRLQLMEFMEEVGARGMDLPSYMYEKSVYTPVSEASSTGNQEPVGSASNDLEEIFKAELSENVEVVIQTGGSMAWKMGEINPNRSQIIHCSSEGVEIVGDEPVKNMGSKDTVVDFMTFCKEEYPADHTILIFWNHGSGPFGFCQDQIYSNDILSLGEFEEALSQVWGENPENAPYEIVGFDACLMASVETAELLHGYANYIVASEEVEPGVGWYYTPWLDALSANPGLNGAQVGKEIVDSMVEAVADFSIRYQPFTGGSQSSTLSVVDVNKAHQVYEAYLELMDAALKASLTDVSALTEMGRAADKTIKYGNTSYEMVNLVDVGRLAENIGEDYPEAVRLGELVSEAVLYNRASMYTRESTGLNVYFPTNVNSIGSLFYYLQYMNDVCKDESMKALYYYKVAGCLNEELSEYVKSKGYPEAKNLDTSALSELINVDIDIAEDGSFSLELPKEMAAMVQSVGVYVNSIEEDIATELGEDDCAVLDENGVITTTFDGKWVSIGGNAFELELMDSTQTTTRYKTAIKHNDEDSYLIIGKDNTTGEFSVLGVYPAEDDEFYGADLATRNMLTLQRGDTVQPIYNTYDMYTRSEKVVEGESFKYTGAGDIGFSPLKDGSYLLSAVLYDLRGDVYYTSVIEMEIKGGRIAAFEPREDLYAASY